MAAEEHALTSTEYIKHHLTNMTYGKMPDVHGSWLRLLKKLIRWGSLQFTWIQWVGLSDLVLFSVCYFGQLRKLQMLAFQLNSNLQSNDYRVCGLKCS